MTHPAGDDRPLNGRLSGLTDVSPMSALLAAQHSGHAETADGMNGLVRIPFTTLSARVHAKNIVSEWHAQHVLLW